MASQSLYRKWRSQTFSDLVGQEPVVRTLKNALSGDSLAHAYLFTGPRGTGKTSMARLLAKTVNCLQPQDGEPCNVCEQCREITIGSSFNVIEIDAASNRGIDSIRELREKVMVPPVTGKYKVYILDEAHMLTTEAFNALLKTLEEPPPHAIFVMATTDVHKMLPTVLSRCQRFDFKRFSLRQIVERLRFVAEHEQVKFEAGAAELIARAAAGGMRDALSLLDQSIAYSGNEISLLQVQSMLGVADPHAIQKFVGHIADSDSSGGLHLIHELAEAGADLRQINVQIAEYARAMMLAKAGAKIAEILDLTEDEIKEIMQMTKKFALEELTEFARIFAQNDLVQKSQGTPQLGLELALLSCIKLHQAVESGQSISSLIVPAANPMPMQVKEKLNAEERPPVEKRAQIAQPANTAPNINAHDLPEEILPFEQKTSILTIRASAAPLTLERIRETWEFIKKRIKTRREGAKIVGLLNGYALAGVENTEKFPVLIIQANAEFHYKALNENETHQAEIEWALKTELKQECKLRLLSPGQYHTPSASIPPPAPKQRESVPAEPSFAPTSSYPTQQFAPSGSAEPLGNQGTNGQQSEQASFSSVAIMDAPQPDLAKTTDVGENRTATGETRQQLAIEKAKSDQVVQETMRMFKAEIKDVHLK